MRLWCALVPAIDAPLVPSLHCRDEDEGFGFVMSEVEGQLATVEFEREQRGWAIFGVGQPRFVVVSWSQTDDPVDAVVLARGRINELPSDLFARRQTIRAVCAPENIDDRILEWAKANLRDKPSYDPLFDDCDVDDAESYLLGRSATYRVDPVTHDISIVDDCVGAVTHDLSDAALFDGGDLSDAPGLYGNPTKLLRAELSVDWEQGASGKCDIAGRLPTVTSLDPGVASRLQNFLVGDTAGWSLGQVKARTATYTIETLTGGVGNYEILTSVREKKPTVKKVVALRNSAGALVDVREEAEDRWDTPPKPTVSGHDNPSVIFKAYSYDWTSVEMSYSVTLSRREILRTQLAVPVQESMVVDAEDPDPKLFALRSIFEDPEVPQWEETHAYAEGDLVVYDGRVWRCNGDHVSVFFDQERIPPIRKRIATGIVKFVQEIRVYWEPYDVDGLPSPESTERFLSTPRGQLCVEHLYLRLRKEALRRLRARHLTFSCRWQDARQVTMADSASITVPWGDGSARLVAGKVYSRELRWDGERGPLLKIEIAVSFGAGGEFEPDDPARYAEPGYAEAGWEEASSTGTEVYHEEIDRSPPLDPISVPLLRSSAYAVLAVGSGNDATLQSSGSSIIEAISAGKSVADVSVLNPTYLSIRMRPLVSERQLVREIDGYGSLIRAPQGVDLS